MVITHYYVKGQAPFQRITDLPDKQRDAIASELHSSVLPIFARFKWEEYLKERDRTEAWLRRAFLKAGGDPEEERPFYFVLGSSEYLLERFHNIGAQIEIPLEEIPDLHISFTFPDSMASKLISESRDPLRYKPDLHGRVFLTSDVCDLLKSTACSKQAKEYIEAQLWSRRYITEYSQRGQRRPR